MLDSPAPVGTKMIVSEAVVIRIYQFLKLGFQFCPLIRFYLYFENRKLDTLPKILTGFRDSP
tara:strand:- start:368 stop:553 length:186 start_codon:yes stop_codon:yes gene_type:complete